MSENLQENNKEKLKPDQSFHSFEAIPTISFEAQALRLYRNHHSLLFLYFSLKLFKEKIVATALTK